MTSIAIHRSANGVLKRFWAVLTLATLIATSLVFSQPEAAEAKSAPGVSLVGKLPEPRLDDTTFSAVVGVDEGRRLLYSIVRIDQDVVLREYDLRSRIPTLNRQQSIGTYSEILLNYASPYMMQIDTKARRMFLMGENTLRIIDLVKFKVVATWDVTTLLPGFNMQGYTYSRADKRVYLLGSMSGHQYASLNALVTKPALVSVVAAVEGVDKPANGPSLVWTKPITQCQQPMDTFAIRALIVRSELRKALYFACIRPDPWPGESGVVRLWIDPKADQQSAQSFEVDFFPISGSYSVGTDQGTRGVAAFDYKTDRFFMQSISQATPGVWVFDGRMSAWVGFIASPDNTNTYLGFNQGSGHYYLASPKYLLTADGRSTPMEQGVVFDIAGINSFIVPDPRTGRLFVSADLQALGLEKEKQRATVVLQDSLPTTRPPKATNYDALTSNIEEGPKTITTFSGGINGFGTRVVAVGGYGGLLSASGQPISVSQVRSGDRGFTAARVPLLDLRGGAASAKAQSLVSDSNTEAELYDAGVQQWPWPQASCFDGGGDAGEQAGEGPGGTAGVKCQLDSERVEAHSNFGEIASPGVSVGSSSFDATSARDPKRGIVTNVTSVVRGVELTAPAGSVSIAKITATAQTVAHGRPKTAAAKWERTLVGIEIRDAEGEVVQRIGECISGPKEDDCEGLAGQINDALDIRMQVSFPTPDVIGSPKGAFGGVGQNVVDFYQGRTVNNQGTTFGGEASSGASPAMQVVVYNDTVEKSRLVFQFAALQANSIYTVSPQAKAPPPIDVIDVPDDTLPPPSGGSSGGSIGTSSLDIAGGGLGGGTIDSPVAAAPVNTPAVIRTVRAFLTRPLSEAVLVGAVWLLFLAAGAGVYKRRALLTIVGGGGV